MERSATSRSANTKANVTPSSIRSEKTRKRVRTLSISSLLGEADESPDEDIRSYSIEQLRRMRKRGEFIPTRPDAEEIELDDSFWQHAKVMPPMFPRKASVHLRLDQDVLGWFKTRGKGHLTRMNAVLRAYVYAEMNKALRAGVRAEAKRRPAAKPGAARTKPQKKTSRL
jgi:uncharacterized protein (DUF4415 family)